MADVVSEVFAFVASHAELTNTVLLAETKVPEIREDEQAAIDAVQRHIQDSWVGLIKAGREALYDRASGDNALQSTMARNRNRDNSIWSRNQADIPLLVKGSYVIAVYFWIAEVPERPGELSLIGKLWMQARKRHILTAIGSGRPGVRITEDDCIQCVAPAIAKGATFAELATPIVATLWPIALEVRRAYLEAEPSG